MDKYLLLFLLNIPFVIFGYVKTFSMYKQSIIRRGGLIARLCFWSIILVGLIFNKEIYQYLVNNGLTDSTPISLMDVVLITGLIFCFFLITRAYSKLDNLEKRVTDLHESLSIKTSLKK